MLSPSQKNKYEYGFPSRHMVLTASLQVLLSDSHSDFFDSSSVIYHTGAIRLCCTFKLNYYSAELTKCIFAFVCPPHPHKK